MPSTAAACPQTIAAMTHVAITATKATAMAPSRTGRNGRGSSRTAPSTRVPDGAVICTVTNGSPEHRQSRSPKSSFDRTATRYTPDVYDDATAARTLAEIRRICLALPEVTERLSHGAPTFFVRDKKTVVMFVDDHHGDDRLAIWCAAPPGCRPSSWSRSPSGSSGRPMSAGGAGSASASTSTPTGTKWRASAPTRSGTSRRSGSSPSSTIGPAEPGVPHGARPVTSHAAPYGAELEPVVGVHGQTTCRQRVEGRRGIEADLDEAAGRHQAGGRRDVVQGEERPDRVPPHDGEHAGVRGVQRFRGDRGVEVGQGRADPRPVSEPVEHPLLDRSRDEPAAGDVPRHPSPVDPPVVGLVARLVGPAPVVAQRQLVTHPEHRDAAPAEDHRVQQQDAGDRQVDGRPVIGLHGGVQPGQAGATSR